MNEELKPCPFCGGKGEIGIADIDVPFFYSVWCENTFKSCTASTPDWSGWHLSEQEAIEAWNRRADNE